MREFVDGNSAIVRGALAAGCTFFAGYPITPASGILMAMMRELPRRGGVAIQGEDEIASIGMCIGAAMAGARAMTATSGPGISLYSENIGLAVMGEVPLVIVDVQRLGPATGGATTVGQADVQFVRWGTSGGYPIIALAPGSVAECYTLTARAFELAERFRVPVFVLTDKEIGMTLATVETSAFPAVAVRERELATRRRAVPLRAGGRRAAHASLRPGRTGSLHRIDARRGGAHHQACPPTVAALNRHLAAKIEEHLDEIEMVDADIQPAARTLVVSYGVTAGAARVAAAPCTRSRHAVSSLVVQSLWPVPESAIATALQGVERVVVPELNLGQYRREIERIAGSREVIGVNRVDGELISPEQIVEAIAMTATSIETVATFRNQLPYPFCPGCGHGSVLDRLDRALVQLGSDPSRVVIVSDIGCSGLSDQYFTTNAFHGLHGRSVTYATGIKLADPSLEVVVVMGDGGTGIGGTHLINAARRNIGITVVVMNNLNFGMTGGQHSTTTPEGAITSTTPGGNLEHPLDICATVGVNGAGYVYRGTSFDEELTDRLVEAIQHPGFALLDVWELCTAYFVKANRFSRRAMESLMADADLRPGVLYRRDVAEYAGAYRSAHAADAPAAPSRCRSRFATGPPSRAHIPGGGRIGGRKGPQRRSAAGRGRDPLRPVGRAARRLPGHGPDRPQHRRAGAIAGRGAAHHGDGSRRPGAAHRRWHAEGQQVSCRDASGGGGGDRARLRERRDSGTRRSSWIRHRSGVRVGRAELALVMLAATVSRLGLLPLEALREAAGSGPFAEANIAAVEAGLAIARG